MPGTFAFLLSCRDSSGSSSDYAVKYVITFYYTFLHTADPLYRSFQCYCIIFQDMACAINLIKLLGLLFNNFQTILIFDKILRL